MPLILTEEQTMLKEAADGFLGENAPLSHLRKLRDSRDADGISREMWRAFGEMGLAGVLIPDEHGGAGLGAVERRSKIGDLGSHDEPVSDVTEPGHPEAEHHGPHEVVPAFARPGRPAYAARGGYNGSGMGLFADLRPTRHWHLRAGLNYRSVHGAAFEDSPLVVELNGVTVFLTLARSFLRSERRVPRERGDAMSTSTQ